MHSKGKGWPEDESLSRRKSSDLFAYVFPTKELVEFTQEYFHMESSTGNLLRTEVLSGEIKVQLK